MHLAYQLAYGRRLHEESCRRRDDEFRQVELLEGLLGYSILAAGIVSRAGSWRYKMLVSIVVRVLLVSRYSVETLAEVPYLIRTLRYGICEGLSLLDNRAS